MHRAAANVDEDWEQSYGDTGESFDQRNKGIIWKSSGSDGGLMGCIGGAVQRTVKSHPLAIFGNLSLQTMTYLK